MAMKSARAVAATSDSTSTKAEGVRQVVKSIRLLTRCARYILSNLLPKPNWDFDPA
jgi:hypothetical protein